MKSPNRLMTFIWTIIVSIALLGIGVRWLVLRPRLVHTSMPCSAVAISSQGRMLATGHELAVESPTEGWAYGSGSLELRAMPSATVARSVPFVDRAVTRQDGRKAIGAVGWMVFSPDSRLLLASNYNNDSVAVLETATGRWLFSRKGRWGKDSRRIFRPVAFSNDSNRVLYLMIEPASGPRDTSETWPNVTHKTWLVWCEARTGSVITKHPQVLGAGEWPMRLVLLPDGVTVVCITKKGDDSSQYGFDGRIVLISARIGKRLRAKTTDHIPIDLACSPDGKRLATLDGNGVARLWDLKLDETGRMTGKTSGPGKGRFSPGGHWLVFSPNGRRLAGVSRDTVAVWDTHDPAATRFLKRRGKEAWVQDLAFSPDGERLAVADREKSLALWPMREGWR